MDAYSLITAGEINNGSEESPGTITVDATGFTGMTKIIDMGPDASAIDRVEVTGSDTATIYCDSANKDYWLINASQDTIYVDSDWSTGYNYGDAIEITVGGETLTVYYGYNAFGTLIPVSLARSE